MDPRVASLDQLAPVRESLVVGGRAHGCRALDLLPYEGLHVRLLPDRGLDLGAASYRGVPLAWTSAVGEAPPSELPREDSWLGAFGGGLGTTCGLRNVGVPSEGHGLHGAFSHQRAERLVVERSPDGRIEVRATIVEADALELRLEVERTIRVRTGEGSLELVDRTTNLGPQPEPAPLLYHVNLGYPLLDEGTRFEVDAAETVPRDADSAAFAERWRRAEAPAAEFAPVVVEHLVREPRARVVNERLGLALELDWSGGTLPRLHQWLHLRAGVYVVALEPSTSSVAGRAADRAAGTLPVLEPGESRVTELRLRALPC